MWKIIISVIVVTLLVLPNIVSAHSEVKIIEMTKDGFSPSEVTIDKNSSVIFANKDSVERWPASNTHPTHEIYPEFDPRRVIAPGESWAFKPQKIGEFKYHDHMNPHFRGVLKVIAEEDANQSVGFFDSVKSWFNNLFQQLRLWFSKTESAKDINRLDKESFIKLSSQKQTEYLHQLIAADGSNKVWRFLKEAFKGQAGSSGNIHDLAHLTGSLIYEKEGFSGLKSCGSEFAFGCYHGFLDKAFAKDLSRLQEAESACLKLGSTAYVSGPSASCIHGIGHGVGSFYSTQDLKKSLSSCRNLTLGQEYCFDGVFMEYVRSKSTAYFKKDDPLYPCNELEKEFGYAYSFACGRNQPALLIDRFEMGFVEIVNTCLSSHSKPFKQACIDSLGFAVASSGDAEKIIAQCQKINQPEFVSRCTQAAAGELVFQEVPSWQEKSKTVCYSLIEGQENCKEYVERLTREYGR